MKNKDFKSHEYFKVVAQTMPIHMNFWQFYEINSEPIGNSEIHRTNAYLMEPFYKPISQILKLCKKDDK